MLRVEAMRLDTRYTARICPSHLSNSEPHEFCTSDLGPKTGVCRIHQAAVFVPGVVLAFQITISYKTYCSSWGHNRCAPWCSPLSPIWIAPQTWAKSVKTLQLAVPIMLSSVFLVSPLHHPPISYRAYRSSWSQLLYVMAFDCVDKADRSCYRLGVILLQSIRNSRQCSLLTHCSST